jgi:hypothetical protein
MQMVLRKLLRRNLGIRQTKEWMIKDTKSISNKVKK